MFYNYSTKKLILLLLAKFHELLFVDYIFMLIDPNATLYVITSLNQFL